MNENSDNELRLAADDHVQHDDLTTRVVGDGITVASIRNLVEHFYQRIQQDELLGPIFNARVTDWETHYEKMTRFWSSATMRAGTYSGRPIEAHKFGGLNDVHFKHWLVMFHETTQEVFSDRDAQVFQELASKMASSIAMRIGVGRI